MTKDIRLIGSFQTITSHGRSVGDVLVDVGADVALRARPRPAVPTDARAVVADGARVPGTRVRAAGGASRRLRHRGRAGQRVATRRYPTSPPGRSAAGSTTSRAGGRTSPWWNQSAVDQTTVAPSTWIPTSRAGRWVKYWV